MPVDWFIIACTFFLTFWIFDVFGWISRKGGFVIYLLFSSSLVLIIMAIIFTFRQTMQRNDSDEHRPQ
ncbi:hypothetical protein C8246_02075 [Paracidovorax avenae]|nr:hypothetical protein C8246_02075 [Paracidovorax avenae]